MSDTDVSRFYRLSREEYTQRSLRGENAVPGICMIFMKERGGFLYSFCKLGHRFPRGSRKQFRVNSNLHFALQSSARVLKREDTEKS